MADEKPQGAIRKFGGWIVTSVVGLASGAFLMYLTPLVNSVIKPAKPVANFAAQVSGGLRILLVAEQKPASASYRA